MQKLILSALVLGVLSGCATQYGNFANIPELGNAQMATDTSLELALLYPPASTHLVFSQPTKDSYGEELVKKLRESGYALEVADAANSSDSRLAYVVDQIGENLFRVQISINSQILSRVYMSSSKGVTPAGFWTRKE
jgi:hypothetical protein